MNRLRPILLVAALAAVPALLVAADVIDTYELDRTQVEQSILGAFRGGWYVFDVGQALRALPADERAAAVRALGGFVKNHVASVGFKAEYARAYKDSKPRRFGMPSLDPGALAKKAIEQAHGGGAAPAGLDKDPNVTLRRRLREFLDLTENVDYDARTTGERRTGSFVDPEYEAKHNAWKMCYRAGREAGEAARAFAEEWLAELEAAAPKR
jgi:hypothetical protein